MITDVSKSSKEQLFDLVMGSNPEANPIVPFNKIDFTDPIFMDAETGIAQAEIYAIPNSGLRGSVEIIYGKLNLADFLIIEDTPTVYLQKDATKADMVVAFNQLYGSALTLEDYAAIGGFPGTITDVGETVSLIAKDTSLAYYGSIDIVVKLLTYPLGNFISNTDLGNFTLAGVHYNQTITFTNPGTKNFDDELTLSATASSGLAVSYESMTPAVCSVDEEGIVGFNKAGTCTIKATQEGNETFYPASPVSQDFTVNAVVPGQPTITGLTGGADAVTVEFAAPIYIGGSDIIDYRVSVNPGSHVVDGNASPIVVGGLVRNTSYTATVQARNVAGYGEGIDSDPFTTTNDVYLDSDITTPNLTGLSYGVSGTPSGTVGLQYTYALDLTSAYQTLQALTQGTVLTQTQGADIVTAVQYADLDGAFRSLWKSTTATTGNSLLWNLQGATVVYNGLNNITSKPTNPQFKYVMELQLRNDVTAPIGRIYLHYNIPIDPTNVINPNE